MLCNFQGFEMLPEQECFRQRCGEFLYQNLMAFLVFFCNQIKRWPYRERTKPLNEPVLFFWRESYLGIKGADLGRRTEDYLVTSKNEQSRRALSVAWYNETELVLSVPPQNLSQVVCRVNVAAV